MNASADNHVVKELEGLLQSFFHAVSFEAAQTPSYAIEGLFIDAGLLIRNSGTTPEVSDVRGFIKPRRASVAAGELVRFHEAEIHAVTQVFGNVAHRFSAYTKSGTLNGTPFQARGMISSQFVLTPDGWRISCMAWDDERPGLPLSSAYVA